MSPITNAFSNDSVFCDATLITITGPATITGLALLILTVPFNMWIGKQQKIIQDSLLKTKDQRIKIVNEILNGMKVSNAFLINQQFYFIHMFTVS